MNNAQPEKPITTSDKCSNVNSMAEKLSQLEKDFPNWNNLYNTQKIETMPWCNERPILIFCKLSLPASGDP
jgi:hypothetical protein